MPARIFRAAAAVLLGAVLLSGCDTMKRLGLWRSDPAAERAARLQLPPDLSAEGINDSMAVPGFSLRNPAGDAAGELSVAKAGGQRWLVIRTEPEQAWNWVRTYLELNGLSIARESMQLGVIESGWLLRPIAVPRGVFSPTVASSADARVADRYVFRVEPGAEPGSAEVYVAHRRIGTEQQGDDAAWSLRPADPFLEAEMLRGLLLYLGKQQLEALQQIAAAEAGGPLASLQRGIGDEVLLVLEDGFGDAWRRVGLAIDRLGFTLEDRDRGEGRYFVRYDPGEAAERGFLRRLAFWRDDPRDDVSLYVIQLREAGDQTVVSVTNEAGEVAPPAVNDRILALLREQLR